MRGKINQEGRLEVAGILFDFDGTLLDTIPLIVESYQAVYRAFALAEPSEAEIIASIGLPLEEVFRQVDPSRVDTLVAAYVAHNHAIIHETVGIFLGIIPMLERLKAMGFKLGVVTAKRRLGVLPSWEDFALDPYFDCLVTMDDSRVHKPDPTPLRIGMERLGLSDPQSVLYVGDAIYDLEAARRGQFPSALVSWTRTAPEVWRPYEPTLVIERACDFPEQLALAPPHPLCV